MMSSDDDPDYAAGAGECESESDGSDVFENIFSTLKKRPSKHPVIKNPRLEQELLHSRKEKYASPSQSSRPLSSKRSPHTPLSSKNVQVSKNVSVVSTPQHASSPHTPSSRRRKPTFQAPSGGYRSLQLPPPAPSTVSQPSNPSSIHDDSSKSALTSTMPPSFSESPLPVEVNTQLESDSVDDNVGVSQALNKMTGLLSELVKRVDNNSNEIRMMKSAILQNNSSSSKSTNQKENREKLTLVRVSCLHAFLYSCGIMYLCICMCGLGGGLRAIYINS